ncbi:hypothetical protein Aab01nite_34550 [Paractinoplanes abujensis]|uniref:Uncharacterized protein n=1 Tax=Paractinoplanes abujensis TaxID=882441 RepID=A0A7W7G866_9ACTN|nr:hypothetical protein [Actinoplanes abujensis]MBB4697646.1 hypothetical protein [Actinoplanes abujensis]GID19865.1 hypothetical protein Aab01nite_34550 [Actinoplanes abujensis]
MQLHEFVDTVTADEPPLSRNADDIIRAGRRQQQRRRAGFATAGAAGLVAAVVAGAFALPSAGTEQTTPDADAPAAPAKAATWPDAAPFTFTFQGFDAGQFQVQDPIVASTAYQIASVYMTGADSNDKPSTGGDEELTQEQLLERKKNAKPSIYAYLTVYRPGAFDPAGIKNGKSTTVNGQQAVQATLTAGLDPTNAVVPGNKLLAWEYTANAWASVTSVSSRETSPSFADLGALVEGLKPGPAKPATLPFTVGYVPAGFKPVQTGTGAMAGLDGIANARGGDYGGATYAKPAPAATGLSAPYDQGTEAGIPGSFNIYVTPSTNSNQKAKAGKTACYPNGFCNVWSADGKVQVQVSNQGTGADLPESELKKIAQSIRVADVADRSTWQPAAKALKQ